MSELKKKAISFIDASRPKTAMYLAIWVSAALIGLSAVGLAKATAFVQGAYFSLFNQFPATVSLLSPLLFICAVWLVQSFAPDAKGSGIPQVLVAIDEAKDGKNIQSVWSTPLVSLKTAFVKIVSSMVGLLGGASIGREGPTVQIASAISLFVGKRFRKYAPQLDARTFLVAGASAGVAAAFNTPIAGIAFAVEELATGSISSFKQTVMLAIIVSGLVAQGLSGNYLYFGHPVVLKTTIGILLLQSILIGTIGGLSGGAFSWILTRSSSIKLSWTKRALITGAICSAIGFYTHGDSSGSGYEVTKRFLEKDTLDDFSLAFPLLKLLATAFSYISGMAGGIFSPCLSIGAGIGLATATVFSFLNFKICALFGMIAFFSGAIQAPLTAVIIVMEMTDEHILAIPFMIAAFTATSAGRRIMNESLYQYLAQKNS